MEGKRLSLPALEDRLQRALFMAAPCAVCADVGADHGLLSAALLQSGRAEHVLASDISEKSLAKARRLLVGLGLDSRATFAVADGLAALDALHGRPVQTVFILGMGGAMLSRILLNGAERLQGARLILGAQTDLPLLRQALCRIRYRIRDEQAVLEKERGYILLGCTPAAEGERAYDERETLLGPVLLQTLPPAWKPILNKRKDMLTAAVEAMERTPRPERAERLAANQRELHYIRETLERYEREATP